MAAEAQRATPLRASMSNARPPRVIGNHTSMALTAVQPQERYAEAGYTGEALRVFDKVPGWAVAHAMRDNSMAPLLRAGEVAVVESDGKPGLLPQEGNLYLIEHVSQRTGRELYERRTRQIAVARMRRGDWWMGPLTHGDGRTIFLSDGPYPDDCDLLASKLIGRVVGIYYPGAFAAGGAL